MQYYLPMGYRVVTRIEAGLPALVYMLEIRSGRTVHPTLRREVLKVVRQFREALPGVALHPDETEDDWSEKRGQHVIERVAS
jgi:hypothetical protein